jgi:hypothetical protein
MNSQTIPVAPRALLQFINLLKAISQIDAMKEGSPLEWTAPAVRT